MQQKHQMPRLATLASLLALTAATPVAADTALECSVQVSSQVEVASCVQAQTRVADLALEKALQFARDSAAELDSGTGRDVALPALEASQTTWLAYRAAHCDYRAALFAGGSGAGIAEDSCIVGLTRQRVAELLAATQ